MRIQPVYGMMTMGLDRCFSGFIPKIIRRVEIGRFHARESSWATPGCQHGQKWHRHFCGSAQIFCQPILPMQIWFSQLLGQVFPIIHFYVGNGIAEPPPRRLTWSSAMRQ